MDGKLLARAREALDGIRKQNEEELARRTQEVYTRAPELRRMDDRLRRLMSEVVAATLGHGTRPLAEVEAESLELQMHRAETLTALGYSSDYIDGVYTCRTCRDAGFVDGKMCSCLKQLYRREVLRDLSALVRLGSESFDSFRLDYYDNTPNTAGINPRRTMSVIFENCRAFARTFGPNSPNLLFSGSTGLGKTYLSACIAKEVSARGFSAVYETAASALEAFEQQKFSRVPEEAEKAAARVKRCLSCDLMILDDLGTEMVTSFSVSALYTLINTRLTAGKKTIISTNLDETGLGRLYTPQIRSRLEGEYLWLRFAGRDIRAIRKECELS